MMTKMANFLAIDLGASSGRVLLGQWDGSCFRLQEMHRFTNGPVNILGHLHWDVLQLWTEIKAGLARYSAQFDQPVAGIGVDTWGVDFALLDRAGHLIGNPHHYRDSRTDGMPELAVTKVPRDQIYQQTGIQFMQLNTLFQLFSMVQANDPQLEWADKLLMMPDLFHYWLTGQMAVEYTIATTSQMLDARKRIWATGLLSRLNIPTQFLPAIVPPGTVLGELRPDVSREAGLGGSTSVIAPGSHDTASAVGAISDLDVHSAYISSGTWSLMGVEIPEPIINPQALELNFTNEGGVGGAICFLKNIPGLWLLQECRRQWQSEGQAYTWDGLLALAEKAEPFRSLVDPDAHEFLSPGDMPNKIHAYCRRTGQPEPLGVGEIARACLESLALKSRQLLADLEMLTGRRLETIRVVGGGSQNRLLCQFTADACQRPVVAGPVEATALGNLMLQVIASGHLSDIRQGRQAIAASIERRTYDPHPSPAWDEAFARFEELVSK
ncbi:MAG TPA: rhamnulokinase family protein [Anaerolineales bacterium]|nr:rhamnulokinase family protein [Anaerolineales bacterium]